MKISKDIDDHYKDLLWMQIVNQEDCNSLQPATCTLYFVLVFFLAIVLAFVLRFAFVRAW